MKPTAPQTAPVGHHASFQRKVAYFERHSAAQQSAAPANTPTTPLVPTPTYHDPADGYQFDVSKQSILTLTFPVNGSVGTDWNVITKAYPLPEPKITTTYTGGHGMVGAGSIKSFSFDLNSIPSLLMPAGSNQACDLGFQASFRGTPGEIRSYIVYIQA